MIVIWLYKELFTFIHIFKNVYDFLLMISHFWQDLHVMILWYDIQIVLLTEQKQGKENQLFDVKNYANKNLKVFYCRLYRW